MKIFYFVSENERSIPVSDGQEEAGEIFTNTDFPVISIENLSKGQGDRFRISGSVVSVEPLEKFRSRVRLDWAKCTYDICTNCHIPVSRDNRPKKQPKVCELCQEAPETVFHFIITLKERTILPIVRREVRQRLFLTGTHANKLLGKTFFASTRHAFFLVCK